MSSFLNALQKRNSGPIPVWFMRQAGRYLPEYQALRKKHDFRTLSHTPDLIEATTMTPFSRLNVDAAILFSDILTCLEFMGSTFHFGEKGPSLSDHGPHVLEKLNALEPARHMSFVGDGIRKTKAKLGETPLIGFAGAPFTLISYLVEGGTSRDFEVTRRFVYEKPEQFTMAMKKIADSIAEYLIYQIECGANAVQIFDSWVGVVPAVVYRDLISPIMKEMIAKVRKTGKPVILYSQPTIYLLSEMVKLQPTAVSIDWRTTLTEAVNLIDATGEDLPVIQGNLDPIVTTLDWERARPYVQGILEEVDELGIREQFIFNVGHGVVPDTQWETLKSIIDFVHEYDL